MAKNKGWACPTCKKVWAPTVKECKDCNVREDTDKTTKGKLLLE